MPSSTSILILGAGPVGAFYGSRLALAPSTTVSVICRSNYSAVATDGFTIHSPKLPPHIFHPHAVYPTPAAALAGAPYTYILITTKALPPPHDSASLLTNGLVSPSTTLVVVQNGLGVEAPFAAMFPQNPLLSAVTVISASQPSPGLIKHNRWTRISIGPYITNTTPPSDEPKTDTTSSSLLATATARNDLLIDLLTQGGIPDAHPHPPTTLQLLRWHKLALNAAMNPSSVLTHGASNRTMAVDPEMSAFLKGVMLEITAAAKAVTGMDFPEGWATPDEVLTSTRRNESGSRPSMWADWVAGGGLEVEGILGEAMRLGEKAGVSMVRVRALYAMVRITVKVRDERLAKGEKEEGLKSQL